MKKDRKYPDVIIFLTRKIGKLLIPLMVFLSASICAEASSLPGPADVLAGYHANPYIRFYEGDTGAAWTTVHPDGNVLSQNGTYTYSGSAGIYRGAEGTEVIPEGVVGRRDPGEILPDGHHYYASAVMNDVVPIGKWVLMHSEGKCVHGPFAACRDYDYYGIGGLSNIKCGGAYDSGWIAYCADCGEPVTGFVYAGEDCVRSIGYLFAGTGDYAKQYPCTHLFFCPVCGDNLENQFQIISHFCRSFVSCNRYTVEFDPDGAFTGTMESLVGYFGDEGTYEGEDVNDPSVIGLNEFIRPGYIFAGWSDTPSGEVIFNDGCSLELIEDYFTCLHSSGDGSDDQTVTLYAVWEECAGTLLINGGSFAGNAGSYNGVINGDLRPGLNEFHKGYMYETVVDVSLLDPPKGYRVEFDTSGGEYIAPGFTETEIIGWIYSSDDPSSEYEETDAAGILLKGYISGSVRGLSSRGDHTYIHSSKNDGCVDIVTALWKSTSIELPVGVKSGTVFDGWYSSPDLNPESFVGRYGDLYSPEGEVILYASFSQPDLEATPDYCGNESFGDLRFSGLTRLDIGGGCSGEVFRYYISPDVAIPEWREAAVDNGGSFSGGDTQIINDTGVYTETRIRNSGIYTIELWGGKGASSGGYEGDNGEYSRCQVFLHEGDILGVYTGKEGDTENNSEGILCHGGEGSYITINGNLFMSSSGGKGADLNVNVRNSYPYTGGMQSFTAEIEGDYTLEVWGAAGNTNSNRETPGGNGGYAKGVVHLVPGNTLYICVGGQNGYNGGGSGASDWNGGYGGNGGGATHIASVAGVLRTLSSRRDSVCIVAGGGGGGSGGGSSAGAGGGYSGNAGRSYWPGGEATAYGGDQNRGGNCFGLSEGGFGYGAPGFRTYYDQGDSPYVQNGGGGGGWYGGGGGRISDNSYGCGGGGGSGYIGGVLGGTMSIGVNAGNGRARISFYISITGEDPVGKDTGLYPEGISYTGHMVNTTGVIYPDGISSGGGCCIIQEPTVRYSDGMSQLILSPDLAAPDAVEGVEIKYDAVTGTIGLYWKLPDDNGTSYKYMARSYFMSDLLEDKNRYAQSDTERLCISTGTYMFYYCIDTERYRSPGYVRNHGSELATPWTELSGKTPDLEFENWYGDLDESDKICGGIEYHPDGNDRYLHIVSMDRAGNISDVCNVAIDGKYAYIPYPVRTCRLEMVSGDALWKDEDEENTYYVRADGSAEFMLRYGAYVDGFARNGYQVEECLFNLSLSDNLTYVFERCDIGQGDCQVSVTEFRKSPVFYLVPLGEPVAVRNEYGKRIDFTESFTTLHEGTMHFYPSCSAMLEEDAYILSGDRGTVSSDHDADLLNGITIIGDATPPVCEVSVNGGDPVRLAASDISNTLIRGVIDRREHEVSVEISVHDEGVGIGGDFLVEVFNTDNGLSGTYEGRDGHLIMNLKLDEDMDEPVFENKLFNGNFIIYVTSEDRVGNRIRESSEPVTELDINGHIVRLLDEISGPVTDSEGRPCMKRGESGFVLASVWGYPDAVLVSFESEEMDGYDTLYIFGNNYADIPEEVRAVYMSEADYLNEIRTDFTIPLEYGENKISVTITAFKGDESLSWECGTGIYAQGTILDELMTILKGPGH